MSKRAIETPSVTKPLTTNKDARSIHPTKGTATPEVGYDREHPFKNTQYKKVGTKSKSGGDAAERTRPTVNPASGVDSHGKHPFDHAGYSKIGQKSKTGGDAAERTLKNKNTSPWRK